MFRYRDDTDSGRKPSFQTTEGRLASAQSQQLFRQLSQLRFWISSEIFEALAGIYSIFQSDDVRLNFVIEG